QTVVFSNSATVTGIATNGLGAPITGLSVRLRNTSSGLELTMTTDGSGRFAFSGIAAGSYQVVANLMVLPIAVDTGQTLEVPVVIDSTPPQVAITAPTSGASIDPRSPLPVTVNATDYLGVAPVSLSAAGVASFSETRGVTPAAPSRSDLFSVPFSTLPATGGSLTLSATARD